MAKRTSIKRVTATEFAKNFGAYRDHVQYQPVVVTSHGRATCVVVSKQVYDELLLLRKLRRRAYNVAELPESTIRAMVKSKMDKKHNYLNKLLDD